MTLTVWQKNSKYTAQSEYGMTEIIDVKHLTVALRPVVASSAAVFWHVNVLRVIEVCKWRVHYWVDDSRLQVKQHGSWYIMFIIGLTVTLHCTSQITGHHRLPCFNTPEETSHCSICHSKNVHYKMFTLFSYMSYSDLKHNFTPQKNLAIAPCLSPLQFVHYFTNRHIDTKCI